MRKPVDKIATVLPNVYSSEKPTRLPVHSCVVLRKLSSMPMPKQLMNP
jgi:hypothetical protein